MSGPRINWMIASSFNRVLLSSTALQYCWHHWPLRQQKRHSRADPQETLCYHTTSVRPNFHSLSVLNQNFPVHNRRTIRWFHWHRLILFNPIVCHLNWMMQVYFRFLLCGHQMINNRVSSPNESCCLQKPILLILCFVEDLTRSLYQLLRKTCFQEIKRFLRTDIERSGYHKNRYYYY